MAWATLARSPSAFVQRMRTQLVAARAVAETLGALATDGVAAGPVVEVAGPREESMVEMAQLFATRRGDAVRVEGMSNQDDPGRDLYESGPMLPGSGAILAGPTFEEWLDSTSS